MTTSEMEDCTCDNCGGEFDILLSTTNHQDKHNKYMWVCDKCFIKLNGINFEDYRLGETSSILYTLDNGIDIIEDFINIYLGNAQDIKAMIDGIEEVKDDK